VQGCAVRDSSAQLVQLVRRDEIHPEAVSSPTVLSTEFGVMNINRETIFLPQNMSFITAVFGS